MTRETIHIHFDKVGERLDTALSAHFPDVSRAQIQNWIKKGQVKEASGKVLSLPSFKAKSPMDLVIERERKKPFEPPRAEDKPHNLGIVFEDEHLLVVDKPVGISVHPGAGRHEGTLVNMLLGHTGGKLSDLNTHERPGIVHRLDKDTSGLLVVAKTNFVHAKLAELLHDHDIRRVYNALVWNLPHPSCGMVETMIGRDPRNRQRMAVLQSGGKRAVTHYRILKQFGLDFTLVECRLETGRTHQIRVHLASINCPVLGDPLYGGRHPRQKKRLPPAMQQAIDALGGQMLHAGELSFRHPVTQQEITLKTEPPRQFQDMMEVLSKGG